MKACVEKWLNDQFGGDGQMVADVYEEYRQTMRRLVGELASARQAGDAAAVDRILHTMKGSAAMVGDEEVSAYAAASRQVGGATDLESRERKLRIFVEEL